MKLMVKSVMPLSMGVWWYAAAYAIFLMLLPFLAKGLKALGREYHLALAVTVLVIWGLTSFIPGMIGINDGFFGFIYLFILFSAYKRYMEPFTTRQVWLMIGTGLGFFLLYTCASITLPLLGHDIGITPPANDSEATSQRNVCSPLSTKRPVFLSMLSS